MNILSSFHIVMHSRKQMPREREGNKEVLDTFFRKADKEDT